jgi:hypothetical protein
VGKLEQKWQPAKGDLTRREKHAGTPSGKRGMPYAFNLASSIPFLAPMGKRQQLIGSSPFSVSLGERGPSSVGVTEFPGLSGRRPEPPFNAHFVCPSPLSVALLLPEVR